MEKEKLKRPNKIQAAFLQARGLLNHVEQNDGLSSYDGEIFSAEKCKDILVGSDQILIRTHVMAWGLFKQTLLKAMKETPELQDFAQDLFVNDKVCTACRGEGSFPDGSFSHPCRRCGTTGVLTAYDLRKLAEKGEQNGS